MDLPKLGGEVRGQKHNETRVDEREEQKEEKFIKRIATVYMWYGENGDEVNKALNTLFGKSGEDLERGVDGQTTFIKSKKSKSFKKTMIKPNKVEPEP